MSLQIPVTETVETWFAAPLTQRKKSRFHPKAIPKNKPTGGSQPSILGASESLTPPELPGGFRYIHYEEWPNR